MFESLKKFIRGWGKIALIILFLAGVVILTRQLSLPDPGVPISDLKPFPLNDYHRLLILAPHCDDETLSSAGLILAAERAGIEVRVVIATNGDGYLFATIQDFRKIYPNAADFIRMGKVRQQESLVALAVLGVKPEQVTFLSYPDRGTPSLWNTHWEPGNPYRSPFTGDTQSPYTLTYNPKSVFAGADYLADITNILESYRPDLVVYPNPEDVHPDHWGLNAFTRLALTLLNHEDPTFRPVELTYLVHRPDYPEVRGLKLQESLTPPTVLYNFLPEWFRIDLTPNDIILKDIAVHAYASQLPLLRGLMESFIRVDEIFAPVTASGLATMVEGNALDPATWKDRSGKAIDPVQRDPVSDYTTRSILPAGDLTAVYVGRNPKGDLLLCDQVRDPTQPEITYILRLKALSDKGIITYQARTGAAPTGWGSMKRSGVYACATVSLVTLGNPWAIYVGATTVSGGRIEDETGWQMVFVTR